MAAIYQWFTGKEVVLTTTLYPLEATDAVDLSIQLNNFLMRPVEEDAMDLSFSFVSGELEQILLQAPHSIQSPCFGFTLIILNLLDGIIINDTGQRFLQKNLLSEYINAKGIANK